MHSRRVVRNPAFFRTIPSPPQWLQVANPALAPSAPVPRQMRQSSGRSKVMVFSDSLNAPLAIRLFEYFKGRSQTAFGVGTNLTNDLGYDALQIVIKMTRCNGQPVAKISDEPSKAMDYDPSYVAYLREVFEVPEAVATAGGDGLDAD